MSGTVEQETCQINCTRLYLYIKPNDIQHVEHFRCIRFDNFDSEARTPDSRAGAASESPFRETFTRLPLPCQYDQERLTTALQQMSQAHGDQKVVLVMK
jgi:hypothetical protein